MSPVTFRHPAIVAHAAAAVDDLSGGRLVFGVGAGWQVREHQMFGIPFPPSTIRHAMFEEYVHYLLSLWRSVGPTSFQGEHYGLHDAVLLPWPERPGGPRLLIGGNGRKRTLPIAARYADEWNAVFVGTDELRDLNSHFDGLLDQPGWPPDAVRRSVILGTIFCRDQCSLQEQLSRGNLSVEGAQHEGVIVGTPEMWVDTLRS